MKFEDFKNDYSQLLGKVCLITFNNSKKKIISTIEKVNKTTFKVKALPDLFYLKNGGKELINSKSLRFIQAILITKEEAKNLIAEFVLSKKRKELKVSFLEKIDNLNVVQLTDISNILK